MRNVLMLRIARPAARIGAAVAVAAGAAGLLGITSATAAPRAAAQPHCKVSISKQFFGVADSGPYGGPQKVLRTGAATSPTWCSASRRWPTT